MIYIFPYNPKSLGAKRLSNSLEAKRIKQEGSRFRGAPNKLVVNWGASTLPQQTQGSPIINPPEAVLHASNKLSFFQSLQGERLTPDFTTDIEEAKEIVKSGKRVVCRQLLRASGGRGIVVADHVQDVVPAPLYVVYKPKKEEYRVHVFRGNVIDVQKKARKMQAPNPNWRIRNHDNGFIYARYNIDPPHCVLDVALASMAKTSLDFGAVDVIYNERENRAYVLEVNTAPGLEGQTVTHYTEALRDV